MVVINLIRAEGEYNRWQINSDLWYKGIPNGDLHELISKIAKKRNTNKLKVQVSYRKFKTAEGFLEIDDNLTWINWYSYKDTEFSLCSTGLRQVLGVKRASKIYFQIV